MNNIEQLKTEVNDIKKSLNELKNNVDISDSEKKTKAEALKAQAENAKQKIQNEIKALENAADDGSKKKKEEAETLLNSFNEIISLYGSIVNVWSSNTPVQQPLPETENKNVFSKAKDWIWTQWSDVWDKEKWKTEWWKNLLRTVWFAATWVWAVSLAYKWIKKLFWWWKNEEEEDDEEETKPKKKKKKKPFWDRRYWKALKYSIIWTPIYYFTHGLMTNKWNILDMFDRNKKNPDAISSAENQVEATEELKEKNPEKFEKYKKLWENVDSQYNQLMDKEIKDWWWGMSIADGYKKYCDNSKLSLEDFKATVPMCMDNQFWAVSNMLSEWGYYAYMREKDIKEFTEMFTKTVDDWTKKLLTCMIPFLWNLNSFKDYKDKSTSDIFETVKQRRFDWEPTERCAELNLFFRQYAKVLNYLQEKRIKLIHNIAEKKFKTQVENWYEEVKNFSTVEEAIQDKKWFETYIESEDDYKNFMGWSIINSIWVIEKQGIFDDKLSESTEAIKTSCDEERAKILEENKNWQDVLDRLRENKGSLTQENYKEWESNVDKIIKDIEEHFDEDRTYNYLSFIHTASNSEEKNKQEFLKESWLLYLKNQLKSKLQDYKLKFSKKSISSEEIEQYITSINSYFAVKKEVAVATLALQTMKSNDPSIVNRVFCTFGALGKDLANSFLRPIDNLVNWEPFDARLATQIPFTIVWWSLMMNNKKRVNSLWRRWIAITPANVWYKLTWNIMRRTSHIGNLPNRILLNTRYNITHGDELLLQDILEWKISWIKAEQIVRTWKIKRKHNLDNGKKYNSIQQFIRNVEGIGDTSVEKNLRSIFTTHVNIGWEEQEISFMKNKTIRDKLLWGSEARWKWKQWYNWYYKRDYNILNEMLVRADNYWFWELSSKIDNLSEGQAKFLKWIVENWNFTNPAEELKGLFEYIDKIDLTGISEENLNKLIGELCNNTADLQKLEKIENRAQRLISVDNPKPGLIDIPEARLKEPIFWEIDNVKSELDDLLKNETDIAKQNQLKKQISELEDFKKEMGTMEDDVFKRLNMIVDEFRSSWTNKSLKEVITEVKKLQKIMDIGDSLTVGWTGWMKATRSIEQILKDLDSNALRQAKNFHPEIADELESVAKIFEKLEIKNASKVLWNADEILKLIKTLVKIGRVA